MAWTIVETPNARYVLLLAPHMVQIEKAPQKFDALVLEQGLYSPEETIRSHDLDN